MSGDVTRLRSAVPAVAGVGEQVQRPGDGPPREPLDLMAEAVRVAALDAGSPAEGLALLDLVDHLDVVNVVSWSYHDLPRQLAERIGVSDVRTSTSEPGGEQSTLALDRAAARIAAGESQVTVVAAGEAVRSLEAAMAGGSALQALEDGVLPAGIPSWTPPPPDATMLQPMDFGTPLNWAHGLGLPHEVYPLWEHPSRRAIGQTAGEALDWAARVWARMSEVAAANPSAWNQTPRSAAEIRTVGPGNRMIAYPYPKLMNALISVNQAAAVILVSAEVAEQLGLDADRLVYPFGGAAAQERLDFLSRPTFERTEAGGAALDDALALAGTDVGGIDLFELYSCFPCVVRMAATHLGLDASDERPLSTAGGLTFFGGPVNGYMLHGIAAMVRALRAGKGERGLLYGQGGYATKHHAMVLGRTPDPAGYAVMDGAARQARLDALPEPAVVADPDGDGVIETFTVKYDREGNPELGIVVGRLGADPTAGDRFVANSTRPDDLAALTDEQAEPIGWSVRLKAGQGEANKFELV